MTTIRLPWTVGPRCGRKRSIEAIMNTEIIAEWFVVSITFAATVMYSYFLGRYVVQVIFRLSRRDRMPIYRKWGVERRLA